MARERKNKKDPGEGVSSGEKAALGMSIGALLGVEKDAEKKEPPEKNKAREEPKTPGEKTGAFRIPKASLRRESKGRGGKTVTVVTLSKDCAVNLEELAKEMRRGLGCGGHVEEGKVILQGDIADRAEEWLLKKGAKRVVR